MLRKVLAMTVALALSAGLFTGCWRSEDGASSSASHSSSQSHSASSSQSHSASGSSSAGGAVSDAVSDAGEAVSDAMSGAAGAASDLIGGAGSAVSDVTKGDASSSASSEASGSSSGSRAAPAAAGAEDGAWMLRLVNAANPLPEDFSVRTANIAGYENRPFDMRAADRLEAMLRDAENAGCKLYLVSGYRTVSRQAALFKRKVETFMAEGFSQQEAERQAAQWVARPGTSEHNLGLAADIVSADWYAQHDDLTADFDQTPAFAWLREHCADYGFILRYPLGKESVTGVTYEPWHYRYVGEEAARAIMDAQLTLEEYLQQQGASNA